MVKRYPHKAIVTFGGGNLVNGDWQESQPFETEITGRYDPSNNESLLVRNSHGDEIRPKAEFYSKQAPIENAERLNIPELGINEVIICWWKFQTHSVIYV